MSAFEPIVKAHDMELRGEKGFVTLGEEEIKILKAQNGIGKFIKDYRTPACLACLAVASFIAAKHPLDEKNILDTAACMAIGTGIVVTALFTQVAVKEERRDNKKATKWMLENGVRPLEDCGPLPEIPVTEIQKRLAVPRPAPFVQ